jgi:hypothetical protein
LGWSSFTVAYLINRVSSHAISNFRHVQFMSSLFPSASMMQSLKSRAFGCVAFVHVYKQHQTKLDSLALVPLWVFLLVKEGTNVISISLLVIGTMFLKMSLRENVSYFTRPQPKRENTNESDFEFEFLISSFPKTSRLISLIPDYTPQPKLSPILSESTSNPSPEGRVYS